MNQWTKERDLCFFCSDFDFQQTYSRPPYNHCPTDWRRNLHCIATLPVPSCNQHVGWHRNFYCIATLPVPVCTYHTDRRHNLYCTTPSSGSLRCTDR